MVYHKNLKSLFNHIQKNVIPDVLKTDVLPVVKKVEQDAIEKFVYDAYNPSSTDGEPYVYERRRSNGGLSDPNNMMARFYTVSGGYEMLVENTTTGQYDSNFEIAGLVEYGDNSGYGEYEYKTNRDGTAWQYLQGRGFTFQAASELSRTLEHVMKFKQGLRRHNIKTF